MGEIKFGEIFVPIQSMSIERNFYPAKFLCYTVLLIDTVLCTCDHVLTVKQLGGPVIPVVNCIHGPCMQVVI